MEPISLNLIVVYDFKKTWMKKGYRFKKKKESLIHAWIDTKKKAGGNNLFLLNYIIIFRVKRI